MQMRARKFIVLKSVHAAREAQRSKIAGGRLPGPTSEMHVPNHLDYPVDNEL